MISSYTPGSNRREQGAGGSLRLIRKLREEQSGRKEAIRRIKELEASALLRTPFTPTLPEPRASLSPTSPKQGGGEAANEAQAATNKEAEKREREMMEELASLRLKLAEQAATKAAYSPQIVESPLPPPPAPPIQQQIAQQTPSPPKRMPPSPTLVRELESLRHTVNEKSRLEIEAKEENIRLMDRVAEVERMRGMEEERRREEEERWVKAEEDRARNAEAAAEALRRADEEKRTAELAQAEAQAEAKKTAEAAKAAEAKVRE